MGCSDACCVADSGDVPCAHLALGAYFDSGSLTTLTADRNIWVCVQ